MAEETGSGTEAGTGDSTTRTEGSGTSVARSSGTPPLQSGRGVTTIADAVVSKVAGIAAREVPGVHNMGGGAARAVGGLTSRMGIGDERSQGVAVEVGEHEAAVDLTITIEYGESIPQVSNAVRDNVAKRIEGITGLSVTEVNIAVNDLFFPGDDQPGEPHEPAAPPRVS